MINVLQDRRHVEELVLLKESLTKIFEQFSHLTSRFQIGNAINRKKWAIFSMDEYLRFYKVAYDLKKSSFPKLVLLGPSVIDFEYYFTLRTLFNFHKVYFDQCSSLLYVDRRGAPENTQLGFDLANKLKLLYALLCLSPKTGRDIVITETNWPITQTAPYAPTSENDCVNLQDHASFLVRYYLLALASGVVNQVYWHQLIAPGYGLIDNRDNSLIKYPAYFAFKFMLSVLDGAEFIKMKRQQDTFRLSFVKQGQKIDVLWSLSSVTLASVIDSAGGKIMTRDGERLKQKDQPITLDGSPVFIIGDAQA